MRKLVARNPTQKNIEFMWVLMHCWGYWLTTHQIAKALGRDNEHTMARRSLTRVCRLGFAAYELAPNGSLLFTLTAKGMQYLKFEDSPDWTAEQILEVAALRAKEVEKCSPKESGTNETK